MTLNKIHLLTALLVVLGALYAVNVFSIGKVSALLIEKPVKLSFVIIASDKEQCGECFDAGAIIDLIESSHNIKMSGNKTVTPDDFSYNKLIERYSIKNLPALVITGDISDERILGAWSSLRGEEKGGAIVMQDLLPYYSLEEEKIKGLIDVVVITDETCEKCFDGNQYMTILKRLGMTEGSLALHDVSSAEGAALVSKYEIKKVPALILSSDASDYSNFAASWKEVGTEEEDGAFVLREVQKIGGVFKNI